MLLLKQAVEQLIAVTNDMLDLGRVEADLGLGPARSLSPGGLLRSIAERHGCGPEARGLTVASRRGAQARVSGHPVLLRRIVENLSTTPQAHAEGTGRI